MLLRNEQQSGIALIAARAAFLTRALARRPACHHLLLLYAR